MLSQSERTDSSDAFFKLKSGYFSGSIFKYSFSSSGYFSLIGINHSFASISILPLCISIVQLPESL